MGGRSRLLPLRHGSCDLQRPRPIFENYHVIFARARSKRFLNGFQETKKAAQSYKTSGKSYIHDYTQSLHEGRKAGKLTIYSRKFLALPAVLVVHFPYNTLVKARITSYLERQCAVQ